MTIEMRNGISWNFRVPDFDGPVKLSTELSFTLIYEIELTPLLYSALVRHFGTAKRL